MKILAKTIMILIAFQSFAQELPNLIPPTPDVYSLSKFGEYPVATNYGTVPINIPLFELKSGDITVPVSISYHSSGIKVNEEASSIGLGWTLNAGGTISKSVRGADDRSFGRSAHTPNTSFIHDGATTLNQYYNIRPTLSFEDGNHEVFWLEHRLVSKEVDGQSDNYFFNFLNHSGKFVFKGGGTNDILIYPVQQNLKFEFKENNGLVGLGYDDDFYAVDDKGFEYWFNDQENVLNEAPLNTMYKSATSWNLSRIYSRNTNNHINFEYEDFDYAKWNYSYSTDFHSHHIHDLPLDIKKSSVSDYHHNFKKNLIEYQTKVLKKIHLDNGNGGKLVFEILDDREDINASKSFRYKSISLYDEHNVLIKKVTFHHSYFDAKATGVQTLVNTEAGRKRLRLDSLTIAGKDQVAEQVYSFDYHSESLPHINSLERDYWGYYNGRDSDKILPSTPYTDYDGANLNPHPDKILAGSLKRIYYPTGGSTEFEFEANDVFANRSDTPVLEPITESYSQSGICSNNHNSQYSRQLDATGVAAASIDVTITFPDIPGAAFGITHPKDVVDGNFVLIDGAGSRIIVDGSGYQLVNGVYKHEPVIIENRTYANPGSISPDLILTYYKYICDNNGNNAYGPRINIKFDRHYGGSTTEYYNASTGGLRIKKITNINENGTAQIKEYDYTNANGNSSGKYVYEGGLPVQWYIGQRYTGSPENTPPRLNDFLTPYPLTRVFDYPLQDYGYAGSIVSYEKVTETITTSNNGSIGKTEYFYDTTQNSSSAIYDYPFPSPIDFPFIPLSDKSYKRILKSKKIYNSNNDLVLKETYNPIYNELDESKQLVVRGKRAFEEIVFCDFQGCTHLYYSNESDYYKRGYEYFRYDGGTPGSNCSISSPWCQNYDNQEFYRRHYSVKSSYLSENETTTTQYDRNGNNPVIKKSKQFYENPAHLQVTQSDVLDSRNGRLRTKYYYAADIFSRSSLPIGDDLTTDEYSEILSLKSRNPSAPIQMENYRSTNPLLEEDDGELLSVQRTIYDGYPYQNVLGNTSHFILPKMVQTVKGTYDATNNPLEDRVTYHSYDNKGNPIEVSRVDGVSIYYIWGYNKEYPIAKIENFTATQATAIQSLITAAENASDIDNDRTMNYLGKEGDVREALDNIRNHASLSNAMITTFTYDPLIGVTSITDSKGYTMYYNYDSFNRLKDVKDASGKLVTDYKYHYKNQQ